MKMILKQTSTESIVYEHMTTYFILIINHCVFCNRFCARAKMNLNENEETEWEVSDDETATSHVNDN